MTHYDLLVLIIGAVGTSILATVVIYDSVTTYWKKR